jgi:hypothetical protein
MCLDFWIPSVLNIDVTVIDPNYGFGGSFTFEQKQLQSKCDDRNLNLVNTDVRFCTNGDHSNDNLIVSSRLMYLPNGKHQFSWNITWQNAANVK